MAIKDPIEAEDFRDSVATVDKLGKRIWLYPKKPKGQYYQYRTYLSWIFLAVLFGLPLIKYQGDPLVLFNIIERKFILFGVHFGPQDFYLFAIGMLIFLVFIILFTVVFGRVFCGWVCPQTIFMEMVFRKIEYWIEGDHNAQKRLDREPWNRSKIFKKVGKQVIFFTISVLIANTFLSYIIGFDEVKKIVLEPISIHMAGFAIMILFSFVFYWVFARLREQVCTTICPYGRLQGVMLDNRSLVVAYDFVRGEPRGKMQKNKETQLHSEPKKACLKTCSACKLGGNSCKADENDKGTIPLTSEEYLASLAPLGDCIDCSLCVQVCPTGIDIRNGTQLECINCTACMDACDEVMTKINRPTKLIRVDSIEGIEQGKRNIVNGRTIAYSVVLFILIAIEIFIFSIRADVEVLLLRTPGMLYQEQEKGIISNLYNYQLINKTNTDMVLTFKLIDFIGEIQIVGEQLPEVAKNENSEGAVFIKIPQEQLRAGKNNLVIGVYHDDHLITKVKTTFFGPEK